MIVLSNDWPGLWHKMDVLHREDVRISWHNA
jgi:hypothetical protein